MKDWARQRASTALQGALVPDWDPEWLSDTPPSVFHLSPPVSPGINTLAFRVSDSIIWGHSRRHRQNNATKSMSNRTWVAEIVWYELWIGRLSLIVYLSVSIVHTHSDAKKGTAGTVYNLPRVEIQTRIRWYKMDWPIINTAGADISPPDGVRMSTESMLFA